MKYVIALLWLAVLAYGGVVMAQSYNAGVPKSYADFTCPTQTAGGWATASYAILATSTPSTNSYGPNRLCAVWANVSNANLRIGDSSIISATQGIPLPGIPAIAGSPSPAPQAFCLQGPVYCAGGGKLSVTEINAQ